MDYATEPLRFRIKKALRYCRLYGFSRTYVKIQGYRHQKRRFVALPPKSTAVDRSQVVGLIGCGNYSFSNIAYYLTKTYGRVIGGCMDIDLHRAASMSEYYGVPLYTSDVEELLDNEAIRFVYIASNHASHAEYAIQALRKGKDVYIEKPHVVNEDQLHRLVETMEHSEGKVFLGFNRPVSRFGRLIQSHLQHEDGPGMYNWFVAGHAIEPSHWYYSPGEGGRVLGNLCHWTDFTYAMAGANPFPILVKPTRAVESDTDIVVSLTFADGSIGVISFSVKGHTFEGIKERFCAHKGNCLITMEDFQRMAVEVGDHKRVYRNFHRDHGHRDNILGAFENSCQRLPYDRPRRLAHIADTAFLFLKVRESLERNEPLCIERYSQADQKVA
jgi:predicted dehydrogenase